MVKITKIDADHPDEWYKGKYMLSFVEEGIFDPEYKGWAAGRMEVRVIDKQWAIDEIRFFTPRTAEWADFREKYELRWVEKAAFEEIVKTIKQKFYTLPDDETIKTLQD